MAHFVIHNDIKTVGTLHGYVQFWKQHWSVAEKLGYTYHSDYGFRVDTANKTFQTDDKFLMYAFSPRCCNGLDYDSALNIIEAWKYFSKLGYTTDCTFLTKKLWKKEKK